MAGRKMVFVGGADTLQLEAGGREYHPGEPIALSDAQRLSLQAAGLQFAPAPDEDAPVVTPEGEPSRLVAAEQLPPGAVVAAVEPSPSADAADESPKRSARKAD